MITDSFSITELSNLTHKSRPTLYKYVSSYEANRLNEVPYIFIKLFDLISTNGVKRSDIINYCTENFEEKKMDPRLVSIITMLKEHRDDIDLDKLDAYIQEELSHGGSN